jgi:hypothetical protein
MKLIRDLLEDIGRHFFSIIANHAHLDIPFSHREPFYGFAILPAKLLVGVATAVRLKHGHRTRYEMGPDLHDMLLHNELHRALDLFLC